MPSNLSHLKNHKVFQGKYIDSGEFGGWFIGSFLPTDHPAHTQQVEVMYQQHPKGWRQTKHYHRQKVEIFLILEGKARYWVNGQE